MKPKGENYWNALKPCHIQSMLARNAETIHNNEIHIRDCKKNTNFCTRDLMNEYYKEIAKFRKTNNKLAEIQKALKGELKSWGI